MSISSLSVGELRVTIDPQSLGFSDTSELQALPLPWIGQERAQTAARFGLGMAQADYNLFVLGEVGSGRSSLLQQLMQSVAADKAVPPDLCYLHNFDAPEKPRALRMPPGQWPDPVNRAFKHMNPKVYIPMQGPSELGASGKLLNWDRTADLKRITVPTLTIGARYDTMDPKHMEWMSKQMPKGHYLHCPNGSHLANYDDQKTYMDGVVKFIKDVDSGAIK